MKEQANLHVHMHRVKPWKVANKDWRGTQNLSNSWEAEFMYGVSNFFLPQQGGWNPIEPTHVWSEAHTRGRVTWIDFRMGILYKIKID